MLARILSAWRGHRRVISLLERYRPERDADLGHAGYDEVNQAARPGFYGFPYLTGKNEACRHHDYAANKAGNLSNVTAPRNDSRNNTGITELPQPQPAFIWYHSQTRRTFPCSARAGAPPWLALCTTMTHRWIVNSSSPPVLTTPSLSMIGCETG
jgi:hypothetical protein